MRIIYLVLISFFLVHTAKWLTYFDKRQIKNEEIADLQIQMHDFKKDVEDVGEIVEINKCSRENNNIAK